MNKLGGWSIDKSTIDLIKKIIPKGSTILEFGSGYGSHVLSIDYKVYSIEHNPEWMYKYNINYIYAPIKIRDDVHKEKIIKKGLIGWYDTDYFKNNLPKEYDLILVDGPTGKIGRYGFFENIHLFKQNTPILFDDIHRSDELFLANKISEFLGKKLNIIENEGKNIGYIL